MKVFISWSGERSRIFATTFATWLGDVIQAVDTFVSSEDIDKGARWASVINKEIAASGFGIICLTKDTIDRRWILFESGALSRRFGDVEEPPVATLILDDLDPGVIPQPLSQFNPTRATKDDLLRLVKSINKAVGEENGVKEPRLEYLYSKMWDDLEAAIKTLLESEPETDKTTDVAPLGPEGKLDEIAAGVRELLRKQVVNQPAFRAARPRRTPVNMKAVRATFALIREREPGLAGYDIELRDGSRQLRLVVPDDADANNLDLLLALNNQLDEFNEDWKISAIRSVSESPDPVDEDAAAQHAAQVADGDEVPAQEVEKIGEDGTD